MQKLITTLLLPFMAAVLTINGAYLSGKITDENNDPLAGAFIQMISKDTSLSTTADPDGNYKIAVPDGDYRMTVTFSGYQPWSMPVLKINGRDLENNIRMTVLETEIAQSEAVAFHVPLIKQDQTATGSTLSSDQIKNLPTRTVNAIKAGQPGTSSVDGAPITIKGSRANPTNYYVDGIRVYGGNTVPVGESRDKKKFAKSEDARTSGDAVITIDNKDLTPITLAEPHRSTPKQPARPNSHAGLLTAGEWNDLDNWAKHWTDLLHDGEIDNYQSIYGFYPKSRYTVLLTNTDDFPVIDAAVTLTDSKGEIIWEARTDNTGKAELWYGLFDKNLQSGKMSAFAIIDDKKQTLGNVKPIEQGLNRFTINRKCSSSQKVDIVWAVDATGSMGDEIEYLKTELLDVIGRVKNINPGLSMRMGTVFYRDVTDDYLVNSSGLSSDISKTVKYIQQQSAGGGGDEPEAVHSALEEAINRQEWSTDAIARICFLVLDASPHQQPEVIASIHRSIRDAAKKGIRVIPVSASGIQKDTEFLMKFFGLATNGTYLFLTDHSGIGGKHLEPTTDEYKVELLNNLLVRIISQYTSMASCDGKSQVVFEQISTDSLRQQAPLQAATYYPNPAVNYVTLDLLFDAQKVTLYNSEGSAVYSLSETTTGRHTIPVADLPAGYYSIRIWKDNQTQSGKILVIKT